MLVVVLPVNTRFGIEYYQIAKARKKTKQMFGSHMQ